MIKKIIINSIILFALSSLIHFLYNSLPCFFTIIIAPVNESVFEHLKMIFSSYMLFLLIKILFHKKNYNNLISSFVISAIFNIVAFLIIYWPISKLISKEIMILTLSIYFITIILSNFVLQKIQEKKENKKLNKIMTLGIIFIYVIFTLLSYYPLKNELFFDKQKSLYGIYKFYY